MRTKLTGPVCLVVVFGTSIPRALPAETPRAPLEFKVRLYDYAHIPRETLASAMGQAVKIFRLAGVELQLVDCGVTEEEFAERPQCRTLSPFRYHLKIITRKMAERVRYPVNTMGFAIPFNAYVFFHRVEELNRREGHRKDLLLGHGMAHELGHLLLGPGHSLLAGLMGRGLHGGQALRASQGALLFHDEEVKQIRARLEEEMLTARR